MFDIAAIGELLIDFTPSGENDQGMQMYARNPGGAPANVLAMAARLGCKTAFIGKVGKDAFGDYLREILEQNGIDCGALVMDPHYSTTLAFVHLDARGDRSFSFYRSPGADVMLTAQEVNLSLIDRANLFHFGSVSLTGEPARSAVRQAVQYACQRGKIISFDPNYRPLLWSSPEKARGEILALVPSVDILKVSEEEMVLLTGETSLEEGSRMLIAMGPTVVIVTLGAKGAYFQCAGGSGHLPAYDVKTIDTTGAGDAFLGAVLYCLRGKSRQSLAGMTKAEWRDITDFANAAGSLTTAARGAIPAMPESREEIETCCRDIPKMK